MNYSLDQKLDEVRSLRARVRILKTDYQIALDSFKLKERNLIDRLAQEENFLCEAEASLKEEALLLYQQGDKSTKEIYNFLKERDLTILHYKEEDALEWAKTHSLFLTLDKKGFESYIRNLKGKGVPSFIKLEVKETVTISSEL
jgi:hypothetical protein